MRSTKPVETVPWLQGTEKDHDDVIVISSRLFRPGFGHKPFNRRLSVCYRMGHGI